MVIGLTGGIASGKSVVADELRRLGAEVIDADQVAREVVAPGTETWARIVEHFRPGIQLPDGSIDRKALGQIIFADSEARATLNRLTHPAIRARMQERLQAARSRRVPGGGAAIVIMEIPLLFESGVTGGLDEIWVVAVRPEVQVERLVRRAGISPEEARQRIGTQLPLEEKIGRADVVIDNNGTLEETRRQVQVHWTRLKSAK